MKNKLTCAITTAFLLITMAVRAQTFEIDQVKQLPSISEGNMKIIAFSIEKLFNEIKNSPQNYSTRKAVNETVYAYYDKDGDGKLDKINPIKGKQYLLLNTLKLQKNDRFLFNLTFDKTGKLLVPEEVFLILYRKEEKDREVQTVGLFAFEIPVSENIRNELSKVRLQNIAKADINSLAGDLNPVEIKIPFSLDYDISLATNTTGKAVKSGKNIKITIDRYFNGAEEEKKLIAMLKEQTNILEYKKGTFDFTIEANSLEYNIDFNIMRGMFWSSQSKSFTVVIEKVKSFTNKNKKL